MHFLIQLKRWLTFLLMMNARTLLGDDLPTGRTRVLVNLVMGLATGAAMFASGWVVWNKTGWYGAGSIAALVVLVVVTHLLKQRTRTA